MIFKSNLVVVEDFAAFWFIQGYKKSTQNPKMSLKWRNPWLVSMASSTMAPSNDAMRTSNEP